MKAVLALLAAAALAACSADGDDSATGNPTAKGEAPGTVFAASADRESGALKVALPGAKIDLDVGGALLADSDFDLDGTKLYPGSVVDRLDVKARETGATDAATVRVAFTAPAAPEVVRAWFLSETAKKERPLRAAGNGLAGSTEEGKAITIELAPAAGGRTSGRVVIDG